LVARTILIGTLLLSWCGSPAAAQTAVCGAIAPAARISELGAFSNLRFTDEHAYGYAVMLWRSGECLFGLLESSQGLAGDTPIGELQDVKYDGTSGHLSFSAKLTTGMVSVKGASRFEPSRDLFAFDGTLQANSVTGTITYILQNNPNFVPTHTDVILGMSRSGAEIMQGSATHREWLLKWRPILQRRGPKW
jgi:hypothetical protein